MVLPSIQLSDVQRDSPGQAELQHPAQPGINKIIVYEHADFEGLSREFTSDVPDLHELDFGDCICSLRVVGQPWIAYTAPKYEGDVYALEEGEYRTVEKNKAFSALRLVSHDLADPQITLYEEPDYAGQSKVVTEETNLTYGYFNDRVSSHVVQRGVWLLYKHPDRGGWYHIAWPGERLPDYKLELGFHNCLSHLRPLAPGRPAVTAHILWDQRKVEDERDVLIDEIVGVNATDLEQTFTTCSSREYVTTTLQSFRFSNATSLRAGLSFTVAVEASNVFTVEKGRSESSTRRDRVEVLLPAKIPPRTQLTIHVVSKETTVSVPVELTISQNERIKTELGEYRCVSGRIISTKYTMKPATPPGGEQAPTPSTLGH
ncbi:epidermal differentiation-specific protein-like [Dermochelys coriacea]|uniref:epidermal differentiation-specific protein-like n=1 Tax=Dermochelys coriacea TaxID=27794 RepID=UPI0018E7A3CC|nr:epidermal differentiation-specific protein-like [Dermochelys coriacea]